MSLAAAGGVQKRARGSGSGGGRGRGRGRGQTRSAPQHTVPFFSGGQLLQLRTHEDLDAFLQDSTRHAAIKVGGCCLRNERFGSQAAAAALVCQP